MQMHLNISYTWCLACEQALWGALVAGQEKEGELAITSLECQFHLQFLCGSPSSEPSDFCRSARSRNKSECKHLKRVMTSLLMSSLPISILHRLFRSRYSNSRDRGNLSFLFPPCQQNAPESLLADYWYPM